MRGLRMRSLPAAASLAWRIARQVRRAVLTIWRDACGCTLDAIFTRSQNEQNPDWNRFQL